MLSKFNNEKGGALIYVLMVLLVLMVFVPGILSMVSATQLQDVRVINQKKTTTLAVSGMKAFLDSGAVSNKKLFLASNYGMATMRTPGGEQIDYYQYAVKPTDAEEYINQIPEPDFSTNETSFKAVFAAIFGDTNHNGIKDEGESHFYKKQLSHLVTVPSMRTEVPTIYPLFEGDLKVSGTTEPGAKIKVLCNGMEYTGIADQSGEFSIPVESALIKGEIVKVTATAEGKNESPIASMTVLDSSEVNTGIVKIIDEDGNVEYRGFQQVYGTDDEMVVLSSVGNYVATDCDKKDGTSSCIDLTAGNGLTIEEGVSLTTANQGKDVGISLTTTGGDIIINYINLTDEANSNYSHIKIVSAGDVYMNNAKLSATRDITIISNGNIYANNATIKNEKSNNGDISIEIIGTGKLYADGLSLSETPTTMPTNICGKVTISDKTTDFGSCK